MSMDKLRELAERGKRLWSMIEDTAPYNRSALAFTGPEVEAIFAYASRLASPPAGDGGEPTDAQVYDAALKWCGEKERETFPEDIAYFKHNWRAMPGLRAYVEAQMRPSPASPAVPVEVLERVLEALKLALPLLKRDVRQSISGYSEDPEADEVDAIEAITARREYAETIQEVAARDAASSALNELTQLVGARK